ncbi:MAG: radical SAM protein [Bacteroidetes bacterium]|nr:radical SAM protein [Bacteroidota bacterium]
MENYSKYNPVPEAVLNEYNKTRANGPQPVLCYAPFKNLYFGHEGRVIACCYNQKYLLGIYPQQSIKEIWFGEKAGILRNYILNNDLSLGCKHCRHMLTAGNFDAVKTKMYDHHKENVNKYPSVFEFELINTCNLECIMCSGRYSSSIRKNREKLPPVSEVYDKIFLEQLVEYIPFLEETKFYGGEPFLVEIYYEIWDMIARLNPQCRISIQTNGTILNNRVKELLQKCNFHICVSMESLEKNRYENIRINGKFETVMDNTSYFREYSRANNTFFGISVCAMRQNWQEIPSFVKFCNSLNAPLYIHTVWNPQHCSLWNLAPEELKKIVSELKAFSLHGGTETERKNSRHFNDFLLQMEQWYEYSVTVREKIHEDIQSVNEVTQNEKIHERIREYVRTLPDFTETAKNEKENHLINRFDEIMVLISDSFQRKVILKRIEKVNISRVMQYLEINSKEQIVQMAVTYAEKSHIDFFLPDINETQEEADIPYFNP